MATTSREQTMTLTLPESQEQTLILSLPEGTRSIADAFDPGRLHVILGISPEMNAILEELASHFGGDKADVINRAVGLLKYLHDAACEGKRVGIVSSDQELEAEITEL